MKQNLQRGPDTMQTRFVKQTYSYSCQVFLWYLNCKKHYILNNLAPKRPTWVFWQHINFGQVLVIGDLYILGWNFNRRWGQGISFICTKFHNIWKYESKVIAWYGFLFFIICKWVVQAKKKITFFSNKNLKLVFKSYICKQLWILYSKINSEFLFLTQISILWKILKS